MKRIICVCMAAMLLAAHAATDVAAQAAGQGRRAAPPATGARAGGQRGAAAAPRRSPGAGPVIVIETTKGNFEIETYPNEAPKSVAHILALVRRNFYNGHRIHRVEPGFVVQFGDPYSRDMTKRGLWGTGGSGRNIGVSEANPKRTHRLGAVALAHPGDPRLADSQMYVALAPVPRLDGDYTVFGQVIAGMDIVQKLAINDVIRRATVREQAPATK